MVVGCRHRAPCNSQQECADLQRLEMVGKTRLQAAVGERLRAIAGREEALVEAWVAQHGWKPDESCIVRQDMPDGSIRMWVEKRGEFDELKRLREENARLNADVDHWVKRVEGYDQERDHMLDDMRAKVRRFEEREPLVQALLRESVNMVRADYGDHGLYKETLREAGDAVRDFKLSALAAEGGGDESA